MKMYSPELTLLSSSVISNEIGVQEEYISKKVIPIIKIEDVYANEFYEANSQGLKPSLRVKISAINYENEQELIYMDTTYSIIRTQNITADEIVLICERKLKNG